MANGILDFLHFERHDIFNFMLDFVLYCFRSKIFCVVFLFNLGLNFYSVEFDSSVQPPEICASSSISLESKSFVSQNLNLFLLPGVSFQKNLKLGISFLKSLVELKLKNKISYYRKLLLRLNELYFISFPRGPPILSFK
ncbi:MAG: hypothetical protein CME65_06825 [Halobacteriovoraceae bacterium]|nr:hypothetical protein [Halobacteriovoraceae bacterium]